MGGSLFWLWLAGSVPSCVEQLPLKQLGWFVWKSRFLFQSSKWHWPVCFRGQMGSAFQELRWSEERTAVLGRLALSRQCCGPWLCELGGLAPPVERLLPGPYVWDSLLECPTLLKACYCLELGAVRKVPGASLSGGAEILSQKAGETACLTRSAPSIK